MILILFSTATLYLFPKVKFRIIDQTLFQLSIIEQKEIMLNLNTIPKDGQLLLETIYSAKYYLMFSSGLNMFSDNYLTDQA